MTAEKIVLIPWDATSDEQYQRMYDQRVACGWRADELPEWKEKQIKGTKFLYWTAIRDDFPDKEKLLQRHVERYPTESKPVVDTARAVGSTAREPSEKPFTPIGHIALEQCPDEDQKLGHPRSTLWVKSLYISWPLQDAGFGRSAMAQTERIAAEAPHFATNLALDTMLGSYQISELHLARLYDRRGIARPKVLRSTESWYARQGWVLVPMPEPEFYPWHADDVEENVQIPVIMMKKDITRL